MMVKNEFSSVSRVIALTQGFSEELIYKLFVEDIAWSDGRWYAVVRWKLVLQNEVMQSLP